jgi:hypothetical protein
MIAKARASEATTTGAVRFCWVWLVVATSVSVAGNVAHAVLTAPMGTVRLAAAAAVVPPAVLLGSTHSVALLVRTHRVGPQYWCALAMTFALAGCAFVLSFDALRDLAVALGIPPDRAWLWPVAIDVSIANSTLALLSLAPRRAGPDGADHCDDAGRHPPAKPAQRSATSSRRDASTPAPGRNAGSARTTRSAQPRGAPQPTSATVTEPGSAQSAERPLAAVPDVAVAPADSAALVRWRPAADALVRNGVTSKDPATVAAVLAEHAAGTPPSRIGRRLDMHHSTVGRILAGAKGLTG